MHISSGMQVLCILGVAGAGRDGCPPTPARSHAVSSFSLAASTPEAVNELFLWVLPQCSIWSERKSHHLPSWSYSGEKQKVRVEKKQLNEIKPGLTSPPGGEDTSPASSFPSEQMFPWAARSTVGSWIWRCKWHLESLGMATLNHVHATALKFCRINSYSFLEQEGIFPSSHQLRS